MDKISASLVTISATQSRQLDDILLKMISNMEEMVECLYAIQTLTMSTKDRNTRDREVQFREIRECLSRYWEAIASTLKKCNVLGNEAMKLATLAKTSTKEEVLALMQKRLSSFKQTGGLASDLIRQHDTFFELYSNYALQIKPTIKGKKLQPTGGYSNGEGALNSFDDACRALKGEVTALRAFLEEETATYTRGLAAANSSPSNFARDDAGAFINKWKKYQPIIVKTTTQIQQYCDAVIIPPTNTVSKKPKPGCLIC